MLKIYLILRAKEDFLGWKKGDIYEMINDVLFTFNNYIDIYLFI